MGIGALGLITLFLALLFFRLPIHASLLVFEGGVSSLICILAFGGMQLSNRLPAVYAIPKESGVYILIVGLFFMQLALYYGEYIGVPSASVRQAHAIRVFFDLLITSLLYQFPQVLVLAVLFTLIGRLKSRLFSRYSHFLSLVDRLYLLNEKVKGS